MVFLGTYIKGEHRDRFLKILVQSGLKLNFWGDRWDKSPLFPSLQPFFRGPGLSGIDYVKAINASKISLGLLSAGNRDEHTQRSFEIPAAGGLLCAQRTPLHEKFYEDWREAVFWDTAYDCAIKCHELLKNDQLRLNIRNSGFQRVHALKVGNEDVCRQILQTLEC